MNSKRNNSFPYGLAAAILLCVLAGSCNGKKKPVEEAPVLFEALDASATGLTFNNHLTPDSQLNMFRYMYFYNGAGVGAADFNKDGLTDLFFSSNQGYNELYLNKGGLKFASITREARIPQDSGWSTGVSVIDINADGLQDVYVCRVGRYQRLNHKNQLLVCDSITKNGMPVFTDRAAEYGLDFQGFSTQAAFLDYDSDGDLDMYLLNHSLRYNSTFRQRDSFANTYDSVSGDRFYRNDGKRFTDVTRAAGINSSVIGYGLGIVVADINLDGWPDLYIGNDFQENDYLYINQKNGTFKDVLTDAMMHTSQFSMGVDAADINNDALPEVISMDMLPADPYILKRSLGEDEYETFRYKLSYGYHYQYARNCLQLNRGNGRFTEAGLYAGLYATDWSWASLWMDFDNDGLKDLFVSNGIPKRLNDIDYINFVSNREIQQKQRGSGLDEKEMNIINNFPQIKLPNKFFKNGADLRFTDMSKEIKDNPDTYSNGAVYADFDNDGDLDVVVSNIDEPALLYKNTSNDSGKAPSATLQLKGAPQNPDAVGARIFVFSGTQIRSYEKNTAKGFQSSMNLPLQVGLKGLKADSVFLVWPDNRFEKINLRPGNMQLQWKKENALFNYDIVNGFQQPVCQPYEDITTASGLQFRHEENEFNEFNREQLIPRMVSAEGPALAVGDINKDGLEDIFIGSSKWKQSALFLQTANGTFVRSLQPAFVADSTYEDIDACFADVNKDGFTDLVVASGGNEFYGHDEHMQPRVYLNNASGILTALPGAFSDIFVTASCVKPYDFNKDGAVDLFIGGRAVPWEYGQTPRSYLLQNDGTGKFEDVTAQVAKDLQYAGLVKQASWVDMDKDGDEDLLLAPEWGHITLFVNDKGRFAKKELGPQNGWWNNALPFDADGDGDLDVLAGNLGQNSRLKASVAEPVRLYHNDFDGNGKKEQALCYYLNGRELPFANKAELEKQLPVLKKKFLYAGDLARAGVNDVFDKEKLNTAQLLEADEFASMLYINDGKGGFTAQPLPWQAQLSPVNDACIIDANGDALPDVLLAGNFYESNIQMGRYDGDYGTVLINKGNGQFVCEIINGVRVSGQVRHIREVTLAGKRKAYVLARNHDAAIVIEKRRVE